MLNLLSDSRVNVIAEVVEVGGRLEHGEIESEPLAVEVGAGEQPPHAVLLLKAQGEVQGETSGLRVLTSDAGPVLLEPLLEGGA